MLTFEKCFEIFLKHTGYAFDSKYFALNLYIFTSLTNKCLLLSLQCRLKQNFFPCPVKLIEYLASASNLCVGP